MAKGWDSEEEAKPFTWEMWRMDKEEESLCGLVQTFYLLDRSALPRGWPDSLAAGVHGAFSF